MDASLLSAANWVESVPEVLEVECDSDCPLKRRCTPQLDPPLPRAPECLQSTREEAFPRLYSSIKEWQTRLLEISPAPQSVFLAVSYTWGAAVFPRSIKINDVECPITKNLYAFIQRFRSARSHMYIWIDALCINQLDLDEKATQVSQMLAIYEKAHTVVIWLGEEGRDTKLAVEYLKWANLDEQVAGITTVDTKGHSKGRLELKPQALCCLQDICSRAWVRRIWVKQEVWAAQRILVCCGTSKLTWSQYLHAPNVVIGPTSDQVEQDQSRTGNTLQSGQHQPTIPSGELACLRYLRKRAEPTQMPEDLDSDELTIYDILRLLNESAKCQTTNARDRIYALMGMAGIKQPKDQTALINSNLTINVDYSIPLELLYRRFAMSIMVHVGAYSVLATDGTFGTCDDLELPSWCPDFRCPTRCKLQSTFRMRSATTHAVNYRIEDEARIRRFRHLNYDMASPMLCLEGYCMATITEPLSVPADWEVCPIINPRPKNSAHAFIQDYPFLKGMLIVPVDWIHNEIQIQGSERISAALADIPWYLDNYAAFAVSTEARPGDIVALVHTVGIPVVLRPIEKG